MLPRGRISGCTKGPHPYPSSSCGKPHGSGIIARLSSSFGRDLYMKTWSKRLFLSATGIAAGWLIAVALTGHAAAQAPAPAAKGQTPAPAAAAATGPTAGEAFKNVTTASLKVLTVSDFLGAMGVMAAALGYDCADCHPGAGSDKVDWVFDTPKKKTARRMVDMVGTINRTNFGGAQMVTCFTCHHGRDLPVTTIALDTLYG